MGAAYVINLVVSILAGVIIAYGLLYVGSLSLLGIRFSHRDGHSLPAQETLIDAARQENATLNGYRFYFLIPALDEEAVIANTIEAVLRDQSGATVIVIDDGSTDDTPTIVRSYEHTGRVRLLRRELPNARLGKGKALNAGLDLVRTTVGALEGAGVLRRDQVIITVMDADGQLTPNATAAVAAEFARDPAVGGLQLAVRIRNRDSIKLQFQDMEFWVLSAMMQFGRVWFGSVSMGGNGQFTRLAALDEVGPEPWSESLTEDLDLGISLAALGWSTTSTTHAYVTQQGVDDLRRLVKQRTRWYQGHMMSISRLPELTRSRHLSTGRFIEYAAYLFIPWCMSLPWPPIELYLLYSMLVRGVTPWAGAANATQATVLGVGWFLFSFAPNIASGFAYARRVKDKGYGGAFLMSIAFFFWSYIGFVAAYRALGRIIMRKNSWAKTAREVESPAVIAGPTEPARVSSLPTPARSRDLPSRSEHLRLVGE